MRCVHLNDLNTCDQCKKTTVFVYGTLRKGGGNHHLLEDADFISKGRTTHNAYKMVTNGGYPMVFYSGPHDGHRVFGELYSVNDGTLSMLDNLEGHPVFFRRRQISIEGEFETRQAWMYFGPSDRRHLPEVELDEHDSYVWPVD